jgi:hypothetical protein
VTGNRPFLSGQPTPCPKGRTPSPTHHTTCVKQIDPFPINLGVDDGHEQTPPSVRCLAPPTALFRTTVSHYVAVELVAAMRPVGTRGSARLGVATAAAIVFSTACNARGGAPAPLAGQQRDELRVAVPRAMTETVGASASSLKESGGSSSSSGESAHQAARQVGVQAQAVVDRQDAASWAPGCRIHHDCSLVASDLAKCAHLGSSWWRRFASLGHAIFTEKGWWWGIGTVRRPSEVLAATSALEGRVIRVRGRLRVGPIFSTRKGCGQEAGRVRCCNRAGGEVIVSDGARTIRIDGLYCHGDDSRSCCNVPAYGQEVVTSGTLLGDTNYNATDENRWHLTNAQVCNVDAR